MKNRKRLIIYSALALPFIVFVVFMATLDPVARKGFFADFKANTAEQFGYEEATEVAPASPAAVSETASAAGGDGAGGDGAPGGGGPGGGGFDPAELFARRDADGDGKLSGEEISERMRENLEQIDSDQDGALTLEEVRNGMQQMRANRGPGGGRGGFDPAQIFARRDADGDGKLTGDELSDRMRENLDQIDTDQDGSVTLEELQARMERMRANFGGGGARGPGGGEAAEDPQAGKPDRPQRPE